jgi:hypothetical protein
MLIYGGHSRLYVVHRTASRFLLTFLRFPQPHRARFFCEGWSGGAHKIQAMPLDTRPCPQLSHYNTRGRVLGQANWAEEVVRLKFAIGFLCVMRMRHFNTRILAKGEGRCKQRHQLSYPAYLASCQEIVHLSLINRPRG